MKRKPMGNRMLLTCAALCLATSFSANAGTWGDLTYEILNNQIMITACDTAATGEMVIPSTIEGFPVAAIGYAAFLSCGSLTNATLGESVTTIGANAFLFCNSLETVTIPDSVTDIGGGAYQGCTSLTTLTLGESVSSMGGGAFAECPGLTRVTIPDSVTHIGSLAFFSCSGLDAALFEGGAPETFGAIVFDDTAADFTVQFYEGASGFTTPTWQGYPCEMLPSFGTWAMAFPEGQRDPSDAPDGDGIPNLMKYAAGLTPGTPHASADLFTCSAEETPSNSVFTVTYYQDHGAFGVSLYPIAASTLTNNNNAWSADGITTMDTGTNDVNGRNIWKATLATEAESGYLRLTAEAD
ncbi:leucine-rich repeat domain-containing protein [Pontiellaceae bacterium B1224]|nr:leucine-rich repeat domain-containing protein [Pontiellaceae bacterium B1224]